MAVDITLLFKASVKTVKTRNKAIGVGFDCTKEDILKRDRPKSGFSTKAKEVISNITKLKDFLLQHRKDYVNVGSLISADVTRMTDSERDQIDQDAQIFMRTCSEAIKHLRTDAEKRVISAQMKEHRGAVLDLIDIYLKGVCKLYSEQRAIRVKRVVDKKRLSRLEPEQKSKVEKTSIEDTERTPQDENNGNTSAHGQNLSVRVCMLLCIVCVCVCVCARTLGFVLIQEIQFLLVVLICGKTTEWRMNYHQRRYRCVFVQFEQENQRLVGEMDNLVDEVRQIEGKVVEISRLQEIFAEKVLQQEAEIDHIHQLVVGATENVKEGNEDIREAIKNNAGFRVWVLFFLVMCSFSLLFLDWYDS
ncbi:syntaxin-18 isoform X1 [Brachyhypopomus gauderio]|uniref:syntaxin-18 isoform X1 n=1 Tax=Brachyhypopomus gauderio TaxID=698409 RepID=UPI004043401B